MQQILFILILLAVSYVAWRRYSVVRQNILLGKPEHISGNSAQRWKNVLLVAFGQKKMFKRWVPAILHFFIYAAFLVTQIELIEIVIDGISGTHRFFAPVLGGFYTFIIGFIEILSFGAFFGTLIFLWRRNGLRLPRFHKAEMRGWPFLDANLILFGELLLLIGIFSMNGADTLLQSYDAAHYPATGTLPISSWLGPALFGGLDMDTLQTIERFGWWLHILVVFGFLLYLPISKHLHIFLAFPNVWFARIKSRGSMDNMPEVMNEVKLMMGLTEAVDESVNMEEDLPEFGAKDVTNLSWKTIMDAYTCTECGRCTSVCPANLTGKKLSPRKVMMDIRDRAEEIGRNIRSGNMEFAQEGATALDKNTYNDGKTLFDYITPEELHACTTCNACVEACPVLINPLEPILHMRRYEILTQSAGPQEWVPMFTSIENSGSVWQVPDARDAWTKEV